MRNAKIEGAVLIAWSTRMASLLSRR